MQGVIALLLASGLIFAAIKGMPEDPVTLLQKVPDPETSARLRAQLGLDDPLVVQYAAYLGNFASGQWGQSLLTGRDVAGEVAVFLPATVEMATLAVILGALLGTALALGAEALGWRGVRSVAGGLGALGLTVPIFWIGLLLMLVFSLWIPVLPPGGRVDYATSAAPPGPTGFLLLDSLLRGDMASLGSALQHLILPVVTLSLYPAALVSGTLAARLREPRLQALIRALRAKGFSPVRIWGVHVLRLVSAPVIAILGTNAGALIGGAVLTETVFAWPGMGRYLVQAVLNRDVFVVQHGLLLVVLLALATVALADLLARRVSPSVRRGEETPDHA